MDRTPGSGERRGRPAASTTPLDETREARVERLFEEHLDRLTAGERLDRGKIEIEHPDVAEDLLRLLETFQALDPAGRVGVDLGTLGDYRLLRQVGRGGMGIVYEAHQVSLDRRVALKVLPAGLGADSRVLSRFIREAQVAGKLQHPNVASVYGMGVESGTPYYAMEFIDGETLAEVLKREKELTPQDAYRWAEAFAGVAEGLQEAHAKAVIHRDLKPSNLILERQGKLRILDFGLARLEGQKSLTVSGEFLGTPLYMSPEQAMARRVRVDHRTDIYSLGATLYEVLTRHPPFEGKDYKETLSQILTRDPVPLRRRNQRIPADLETIVLKCLHKDPADRYGTAEALSQDLRRFVRGDPVEAQAQPLWEKLARRAWRKRNALGVLAITLLLLATLGSLFQLHLREVRKRAYEVFRETVLHAVWDLEIGCRTEPGKGFFTPTKHPQRFLTGALYEEKLTPLEDVVLKLKGAVHTFPREAYGHYHLAKALFLLGKKEEALKNLDSALSGDPGFEAALALRTVLREDGETGTIQEVISSAERVVDKGLLGDWLQAQRATVRGRWKEAAVAYRKLLAAAGRSGEPYPGASIELRVGSARAFAAAGDWNNAIEAFTLVRDHWPEALEPALLLGQTYLLKGEDAQAEETFQRLFKETERKDEAALGAAGIYWDLFARECDLERGLAWTERMQEVCAKQLARSILLFNQGRLDQAWRAVNRALEPNLDPSWA